MILAAKAVENAIHGKEGVGNFVTDYDLAVQEALSGSLLALMPGARILGEEGESPLESLQGDCFIIDPIDGTANFIRGYRHSAISVAWVRDGIPRAGVVYNPYLDETFSAEAGRGAYCNGRPISVSGRALRESVLLFGASSYDRADTEETFRILRALFDLAEDVRCTGSAALDLCYVASGRCDLFFELRLSPWDYAAGELILREAGGIATDIAGAPLSYLQGGSVLAAGAELHPQCLAAVQAGRQRA